MKIYNKFVESKKEPLNKNDIWFDGSVFKIYKEGEWVTITLTKEAIDRIIEYAKSLDIYVMVKELPEFGEKGKIYVLQTIVGDSIELSEHVWENDSWKLVGNFNSVSLVLDNELSETSHNAVANRVITEALNTKVNKSELATPDWNASEGEEGYIKNRTHYFNELAFVKFSTLSYRHDTANQILEIDTNRDPEVAYINNSGTYLRFSYTESIDIDDLGLDIYLGDNGTTTSVYIDYSNCGDSFDYIIGILNSTSFAFSYDESDVVLKLNELFIPDTIARKEYVNERIEDIEVFVEDLQSTKIDKEADDYYPQLAVGLADNLSGVDVVDSEVNFRRSGGGAISDGVARIEAIKGNSVVWNQLIRGTLTSSGNTTITNDGDDWTITPDGENVYPGIKQDNFLVPKEHKYLVVYDTLFEGTLSVGINMCGQSQEKNLTSGGSWISDQRIIKYTAGENKAIILFFRNAKSEIKVRNFIVIDLTQMFGAGNEPTTIEEFYARIPMGVDLNSYNEGEVIHMDVQSIESVGVNQWDEEWEVGRYDVNNGSIMNGQNQIRSANLIPVLPNSTYNYSGSFSFVAILEYGKDKTFLRNLGGKKNQVQISADCHYVNIYTDSVYGTIYKNDICINLSDTSINGKYFPYVKRTEDLSIIRKYFPDGMKSAGTAHDEIRYNKVTQKWEKVVRIGEIGFSEARAYNIENTFFLPIADMKVPTTNAERGTGLLCAKYPMHGGVDGYNVAGMSDKSMLRMNNGNIYIKDSAFGSDATAFKAAMDGVMLYYELAEPIVTELDEADQFKDLDYAVWNAGTEKAIAEGKSAPLAADITYGFNAIGKIKELESLVAALRAKVGI